MMTGPGLALFYGGLVRKKNVLGTMMQSFILMAVVTVLWAVVGYSLALGQGSSFLGGLRYAFLNGVGSAPNADYAPTIPQQTFMVCQLMFAIVTPALISGAFLWMALCLAGIATRKNLLGVTSIVRALGLEPACYAPDPGLLPPPCPGSGQAHSRLARSPLPAPPRHPWRERQVRPRRGRPQAHLLHFATQRSCNPLIRHDGAALNAKL